MYVVGGKKLILAFFVPWFLYGSGQYVMDGFLQIRLPVWARAVATRLVAITPCVIVSVLFPSGPALNEIVNVVNSSLSVLLPFALTPLVKVCRSL